MAASTGISRNTERGKVRPEILTRVEELAATLGLAEVDVKCSFRS
jgi:hypothetical protein